MHHRLIQAVTVGGAASLLALSSLTGALAHSTVVDDGVVDSGKETHAHDLQQHGHVEGHLPAKQEGQLDLVSTLQLKNVSPGKIADVGVLGTTAYLAAWGQDTCSYNGVHVVDIADLSAPREIAFIPSKEGSFPGEGVQALPLSTSAFTGDVLVTNNEICKDAAGFGGVNIYDVTDPAHPTPLSVGFGDDVVPGEGKKDAHETHSVFAWDAGDRAYAVLVDNEEGVDLDIVDITDPRNPALIAEYDLDREFPRITDHLGTGSSFLHDMVVKRIGTRFVMLASYWDGGYVKLDVTDPRRASYLGDTDFPLADPEMREEGVTVKPEGNAHQAEFTKDDKYVVAADEDFTPVSVTSRVVGGADFTATVGDNTELAAGDRFGGTPRFVGLACDTSGALPAPAGATVALVERGTCTFAEKVQNAQDAGYTAAIVFNNRLECTGLLNMTLPGPDIPALFVGRDTGFRLLGVPGDPCAATPAGELGTTGLPVEVFAVFDGWGYAHLYKNENGKMTELDTYAVPEAHDPAKAHGFGDLSIHEVAVSGKRADVAYFSYYAAGLRVAEIRKGKLVETAAYIGPDGSNFWGVEAFTTADGKEYVAASDRDSGLYLFEYTPVN